MGTVIDLSTGTSTIFSSERDPTLPRTARTSLLPSSSPSDPPAAFPSPPKVMSSIQEESEDCDFGDGWRIEGVSDVSDDEVAASSTRGKATSSRGARSSPRSSQTGSSRTLTSRSVATPTGEDDTQYIPWSSSPYLFDGGESENIDTTAISTSSKRKTPSGGTPSSGKSAGKKATLAELSTNDPPSGSTRTPRQIAPLTTIDTNIDDEDEYDLPDDWDDIDPDAFIPAHPSTTPSRPTDRIRSVSPIEVAPFHSDPVDVPPAIPHPIKLISDLPPDVQDFYLNHWRRGADKAAAGSKSGATKVVGGALAVESESEEEDIPLAKKKKAPPRFGNWRGRGFGRGRGRGRGRPKSKR